MIQLLADVNMEGHVSRLVTSMQSPYWASLWQHLAIQARRFSDVGLAKDASDTEVYDLCQQRRLYLITNNRNEDGLESLESCIRLYNSIISLPIFTISDAGRILHSRDYRERVVESLYDAILRIDQLAGTGRIYLP